MTDRPSAYPLWQTTIPKYSFAHHFLLRGLLALAALHLCEETSQGDSKNRYVEQASAHHELAITGYREQLLAISERNSEALLPFSAIIAGISFAFLRHSASALSSTDCISGVLRVFDLLIGAKAVVIEARQWIGQDHPAFIAISPDIENASSSQVGKDASAALDAFSPVVNGYTPTAFQESLQAVINQGDQSGAMDYVMAYNDAIDGIRKLYFCTGTDRPDITMVLAWPVMAHPLYMQLLKRNDIMALVILAHFGAALHCLNGIWWAQGLGQHLVKATSQVIPADWIYCLQWPLSFTRMDPRYYSRAEGASILP